MLPKAIKELIMEYAWGLEHSERLQRCLYEMDFKNRLQFVYRPFPFSGFGIKYGWNLVDFDNYSGHLRHFSDLDYNFV